jgi:transcriptional regulator
LYISPVDAALSEEEWRTFVQAQQFGHLVAAGRGRDIPVVVPTQFVLEGDEIVLHLVARNPMIEAIRENPRVLMSVAGDWAYIPSAWKVVEGEDPLLGIPTTYYAAAQLAGNATVVDTPEGLAEILRTQEAAFQPGLDAADPTAHIKRFAAIRGIKITLDDVRAKFKYGGNVDVEHRRAVIEHLKERNGPGDSVAASHTIRRIEASES